METPEVWNEIRLEREELSEVAREQYVASR